METKHTPGPWKVDKWIGLTNPLFIKGDRNGEACVVAEKLYDENNEPTLDEVEANARLIAAAPELLAALSGLLKSFIHIDGDDKGNKVRTAIFEHCPNVRTAATKARTAIAKAEGNQQ